MYPVVEGRARAMQHNLQDAERKHVLPLVLHGDAAFSGQGIVAEVLNLSLLKGYRTGGTVHLVINNQIGFTTGPDEARSSRYATDVAQMLQSPILHINGESPEDLVWAADFALQFRQKFGRDIILDMYCYRRLGHNETDQAAFTAPMQTKRIEARPTAAALYGTALRERGELTEQQERDIRKDLWEGMEQAYLQMKENSADYLLPATAQDADETPIPRTSIRTGISPELFQRIGNILTELPDGFTPHPTLENASWLAAGRPSGKADRWTGPWRNPWPGAACSRKTTPCACPARTVSAAPSPSGTPSCMTSMTAPCTLLWKS